MIWAWEGKGLALLDTASTQRSEKLRWYILSSRMMMSDSGIIERYNILPVTFADMSHALQNDPAVLRNGIANIFYIKNREGLLMCLHAYLTDEGWYADANSIQRGFRWRDKRRVFSL